jgi:hypothetical protein
VRSTECERAGTLTLNGIEFKLPRRNIMSYYDERDSLSPQQIHRARWTLDQRRRHGMAMPVNDGAGNPIEAESLRFEASGDFPVAVQPMKGYGSGTWSGGAQLFCKTPNAASVTLMVPVAAGGRYRIDVYATLAPDYGVWQASLDGKKLGPPVNGYGPGVFESGRIELGRRRLAKGEHRLTCTVTGRDQSSAGGFLGIDCVDLVAEP